MPLKARLRKIFSSPMFKNMRENIHKASHSSIVQFDSQWSCVEWPSAYHFPNFNRRPPQPAMLTCISNITNPRKLGTIVKQFLPKLLIVFAVPRVLSWMVFMPYPVLDLPRENRCDDSVRPARVRFELLVTRQDNFVPVFSRGTETEIYV